MGMIACFQMVDNQCINQLLEKDAEPLDRIINSKNVRGAYEKDYSVIDGRRYTVRFCFLRIQGKK